MVRNRNGFWMSPKFFMSLDDRGSAGNNGGGETNSAGEGQNDGVGDENYSSEDSNNKNEPDAKTLTAQIEQLKADLDYMKNVLAYMLEPVVMAIVNLMKELMFYVGYIAKAWTGKNIFENANKSLANANKQAKELQKTFSVIWDL